MSVNELSCARDRHSRTHNSNQLRTGHVIAHEGEEFRVQTKVTVRDTLFLEDNELGNNGFKHEPLELPCGIRKKCHWKPTNGSSKGLAHVRNGEIERSQRATTV